MHSRKILAVYMIQLVAVFSSNIFLVVNGSFDRCLTFSSQSNRHGVKPSLSMIEESGVTPLSPGTVTVFGWVYFVEEDGLTTRPLKGVKVDLYDEEWGLIPDWYFATTYTNDEGYYEFPPIENSNGLPSEDGLDLYVKVYSDSSIANVKKTGGDLYAVESEHLSNCDDGEVQIDITVNGTERGWCTILDTIRIGHEYAVSLGYSHEKVQVKWPSDDTSVELDGLTIHIIPDHQWDEDAILHEYGHSIQHGLYGEWIPGSIGPHEWNQRTNSSIAFSEGWAYFFATVANFEMGYGDPLYPKDSWFKAIHYIPAIIDRDLEIDDHVEGEDVEGAVACLLWDIYDSPEDDLKHRTDSLSAGMSPIWDVLANYLTAGHHVYNIHPEFWNGWFDKGHNYYQVMWDIYYHHCLPVYDLPPETPSTPSGPTSGYVGATYTYSTNTTDPHGDLIRYIFDWGDDTSNWTDWHESGATASASHSWSSTGTYDVKVKAQDIHGPLGASMNSSWSSSLTVSVRNPDLSVLAEDQYCNPLTTGDVYIDDELVGFTGATFPVVPGTHEVFVNDFWENGTTGYRYWFTNWTDGSVDKRRNITVVEDRTITACFNKKPCPGDVSGDGTVDIRDIVFVSLRFGAGRGHPDWDSRADLNCDNIIDTKDIVIVALNYGCDCSQ